MVALEKHTRSPRLHVFVVVVLLFYGLFSALPLSERKK